MKLKKSELLYGKYGIRFSPIPRYRYGCEMGVGINVEWLSY